MEMSVVGVVLPLTFTVFPENNAGDADRFPAVTAEDSTEAGGLRNCSHENYSLEKRDTLSIDQENGGYRNVGGSVQTQDTVHRA